MDGRSRRSSWRLAQRRRGSALPTPRSRRDVAGRPRARGKEIARARPLQVFRLMAKPIATNVQVHVPAVGERGVLQLLISKPELNGAEVVVRGGLNENGRLAVELTKSRVKMAVKPANISVTSGEQPPAAVDVPAQVSTVPTEPEGYPDEELKNDLPR